MYSYKDIKERSESCDEIVVKYIDTMELLDIYEQNSTQIHGWECWLKYGDGSLVQSKRYRETIDYSSLPINSTIALVKCLIMQSHTEWEAKPEVRGASLLFCIINKK